MPSNMAQQMKLGRKCSLCGAKIKDTNKTTVCFRCQDNMSPNAAKAAKVKLYLRANDGGSETFCYPPPDILGK